MRNLDGVFIEEKNKLENAPIFLYTIEEYDGSNDLHLAAYAENVTFDGITYTRFPIQHDIITENTSGEVDSVKVKIANASREIQAYLEAYDWRKKKVIIKTVFANQLSDPDVFRDDIYYIASYVMNAEAAEFELSSKLDILQVTLPRRVYLRNHCRFKFKGTECGYAGAATTCNKTLQQCRAYSNQLRFGGFPSIPTRRIYL